MDENNIFQEPEMNQGELTADGKKPLDVAALVLGIVALVAAAFLPLATYVCAIIGLVFAIKHRHEKRTTVALIICIVAIIAGIASHIYAIRTMMEIMENIAA